MICLSRFRSYRKWICWMMISRFAKIFFAVLLLHAALAGRVYAGFEKLYIDGVMFEGTYIVDMDEVYLNEKDTFRLLGRDDILWDPSTLTVSVGDRPLKAQIYTYQGEIYYPFLSMCRELRYPVRWDYKQVPNSIYVTMEAVMGDGADEEREQTSSRRRQRGLRIMLFHEEYIRNVMETVTAIRIQADVKNNYARGIDRAVARCVFFYPNSEDIFYEDTVEITNLRGGESRRVIFYTGNPSEIDVLEYRLSVEEIKN